MKQPQATFDTIAIGRGSDQAGVRAYNERLILSLVRRNGAMPRVEIARSTGLSAQTVSVIIRNLEQDGLIQRGERQRGRVGQPSMPMHLKADGVFSFGLKIGRRSVELVLVDFLGSIRASLHQTYRWPRPSDIIRFTLDAIEHFSADLSIAERQRIAGLGIAMPFELWNWIEEVGAPAQDMQAWQSADLANDLQQRLPYPVFSQNDATAACGAELTFGGGSQFSDFIYFYIGSFIGGGVVINDTLYSGRTGNAGALGSMPIAEPVSGSTTQEKRPAQLIDTASLFVLERQLQQAGIDTARLWQTPQNWEIFSPMINSWIDSTARSLAYAITASASVIDFSAAIIDGWLPAALRDQIVCATAREMRTFNLQGIHPPHIIAGQVGIHAKALGAARLPLFNRYLFDQSVLFKHAQ